jgi:hypothetical protein
VEFTRDKEGLLEVYSSEAGRLEIRGHYGVGKNALPATLKREWTQEDDEHASSSNSDDGGYTLKAIYDSDDDGKADSDDDEPDYTACSAETAGTVEGVRTRC